MALVAALLRRSGAIFPYLDDWLLKASSPQAVVAHLQTTANLLHSLGFTINVPKSHLAPSQMLPFIGAILDTVQFRAYPPEWRVQDIWAMILDFSETDSEAPGSDDPWYPTGDPLELALAGCAVGSVPMGTAPGKPF